MSEIISDLKKLQQRLETTYGDLENCRKDYERSGTQCEDYREQIAKLTQENMQLQQIITSRHRDSHSQIDFNAVLQKTQEENSRLVDRINHIGQDSAKKCQEYHQKIGTLQQTVSDQQGRLAVLELDLKQALDQITSLQQDKDNVESALNKERRDRALDAQNRSTQGEASETMKARFVKMKQELIKTQRELDILKRTG